MVFRKRVGFICSVVTIAMILAISPNAFAHSGAEAHGDEVCGSKVIELIKELIPKKKPASKQRPAKKKKVKAEVTPKTLVGCDDAYMRGSYPLAAKGYEALLAKKVSVVECSIGLARALGASGKYAEAVTILEAQNKLAIDDAAWNLAYGQSLGRVGRYQEALVAVERAAKLKPLWAPVIFTQGQLLETFGREKDALKIYDRMSKILAQDDYKPTARELVALGQIFDRHSILKGFKASEHAKNILHKYLQESYLVADKKYWLGNVAAGDFLLSKHRISGAKIEYSIALKLNKRCTEAHVGIAAIQLASWKFEDCMKTIETALKINPNHHDALLVKASCLMRWRKTAQVPAVIDKVLATNPNHIEAMSLMSAAHVCLLDDEKAKPYAKRVAKINANCYQLPNTIAHWLTAGRQYSRAEKYYLEAIALSPEAADPLAGLGKMYMQTGDELKAQSYLERAKEKDDFRIDVINYLTIVDRVLDEDLFAVKETEHFIVKVSRKYDLVLLDQVSDFMESIYDNICGNFAFEPKRKTLIEIMPTHQQFSLRIAGRESIPTIGACTGRVIVLAPPHKDRGSLHNWANVLRHEYTHTVTLLGTNNRIPHWFTEACAVWTQPDKRNYGYVTILVNAVRAKRLFPVSEMNWSFIKPKRRGDRSQAYAQSEWAFEYIISAHGFGKIAEMLKGFAVGKTQAEVFEEILGVSEKEFDEKFAIWASGQVEQWGMNPQGLASITEAKKAAEKNPKDAGIQGDYAYAVYRASRGRNTTEAKKIATKALKLDKNCVKALIVMSEILFKGKKYDEAIVLASRLGDVDPSTKAGPKILSQCYVEKKSWVKAIDALELLQLRHPIDSYSYVNLAKIYSLLGRLDDVLPNLLYLHQHSMSNQQFARQIAEIYQLQGKHESSLKYFREIARINPYEASSYQSLVGIQLRIKDYAGAVKSAKLLCLLDPNKAESWDYVTKAHYSFGRATKDRSQLLKAREAAKKSIAIFGSGGRGDMFLLKIDTELETLDKGGK